MPVEHLNRRRPGDPSARARLAESLWVVVSALGQVRKVAEEYGCLDIRDAVLSRETDLYALADAVESGGSLPEAAMRSGDLDGV